MKKIINITLSLLLITCSSLKADDCIALANYEENESYSTGYGCQDGIFNAVSTSMLGWGIGLFAGIALLSGLIHNAHNAHSSSTDTTSSSSNNTSN